MAIFIRKLLLEKQWLLTLHIAQYSGGLSYILYMNDMSKDTRIPIKSAVNIENTFLLSLNDSHSYYKNNLTLKRRISRPQNNTTFTRIMR